MRKTLSKYRILIIISGILILIGVIVLFIVANNYSNKIKTEIPKRFAVATDSLYSISVASVNVSIITRSVTLKNVSIRVDSNKMAQQVKDSCAKKQYFNIYVPKLRVGSIMWDKLVGGEGLSCRIIKIIDPQIKITKTDSTLCKYTVQKQPKNRRELTASVVRMVNGIVTYTISESTFKFEQANVTLQDWENNTDSSHFLMAKKGTISAGTFSLNNPNNDYHFSINDLEFSSISHKLTGSNMRLKLKGTEQDFYKKHNKQKEIYDLFFPTLEVTRIDWKKLLNQQQLTASVVYLNNFRVNVLFSRIPAENKESKLGNFPNQLLQKLKLPLYLKEILLHNGSITYTEESDVTLQRASIFVDELEGSITNITNKKDLTTVNNECHALFNAKLNEYSDISAKLSFALNKPKGDFSLQLNINDLKGKQITDQTKALTNIAVRSLNMKNLSLSLRGNERGTKGAFTMQYSNLGIKILKDSDDKKKEKRKKGLITFVANNLILYSANPMPGKPVRKVKTNIKRNETKSFFNLIWRNIHAGVQETTVRDKKVIDWMRREDAKNKAKKAKEKAKEQ